MGFSADDLGAEMRELKGKSREGREVPRQAQDERVFLAARN